jgi:predicted TIM-barrel fold metal-dependent hydrolase
MLNNSTIRKKIFQKVFQTTFIDTHEHLIEESERFTGPLHPRMQSDDWSVIFSQLISADMISAGMPEEIRTKFYSKKVDPMDKWALLEPYWPAIKNTGYGQAISISINLLYDIQELSVKTVQKLQAGYKRLCRPGFYKYILCDLAKIESCQVCTNMTPFRESEMPELLMQDINISSMIDCSNNERLIEPTGIKVSCLEDWHKMIDWWFNKYGNDAVAVKSVNAYRRNIDYEKVTAEKSAPIFSKIVNGLKPTSEEKKSLEDHLFWYTVEKATKFNLPVKLHTGYYSDINKMPLSRIKKNPESAATLCRMAPDTKFIFFHICYPYYEELISIAKHYTNAFVDMCFSWILNPIAAKDFLKKYLVTAPSNKILTFGGDFRPVEPVLGHAVMTRRGIALALSELVAEGWLSKKNALELIDSIMHENARKLFNLSTKMKTLKKENL